MIFHIAICNNTYSQIGEYTVKYGDSIHKFPYSEDMGVFIDDFFTQALINGYDIKNISDLRCVFLIENIEKAFGKKAHGFTMIDREDKKSVFVDYYIPRYLPTLISAVFYHEMFHVLVNPKGHCYGIFCPYILRGGEYINIEEVIRIWDDDAKKEYFQYLKDNL